MKKTAKLFCFCAAIAVIFSATIVQAVLIKSYEGVGMSDTTGSTSTFTIGDTVGVTQGSKSLGISSPGGWWDWIGTDWDAPDSGGPSLAAIIAGNNQIQLDVTAPAGTGQWYDEVKIEAQLVGDGVNSALGFKTLGMSPNGPTMATLTWDYSSSIFTNPTPSWMQIQWHVVTDGVAKTYNIDNLRAVPEPATLVLLAMGGLMAIFYWRKR
jgi:hypothetical protein